MKKRILAIDDSKAIRFLLQTLLSKNYQVITAADGCSAINWLAQNDPPELIIVDPQLPDMQSWELIEQLTTSGLYGSIPMIVLSALDKSETEEKCLEFDVAAYFTKPFNPIDLMQAVHATIQQGEKVAAY
ncbi:MAG TPA: response regulator [Chitinophagaceae bacterium]|nr:response regulator [Chitinophagaceae bacterium]